MILLDGKLVSASVKSNIKAEVESLMINAKRKPHLAAVIVGNNDASRYYVQSKIKSCNESNLDSTLIELNEDTTEQELLNVIDGLNHNPAIDGYIVQLPLPKHIDDQKIIEAIDPNKDVDGFHPINQGRLALNQKTYLPATPYGIMQLLEYYKIETSGKHAVVLGRSHIVGQPMSVLLGQNRPFGNCTVTLCHSHTKHLNALLMQADIIVAAIGKPHFITAEMIKQGAIVIDVGINRISDATSKTGYRLVGDVDFENVKQKCAYITPVPGGVGLMTVASLMKNTLQAWKTNMGLA
jgi:methylenetetrahydrofolate dehydrogenase (NADP+)/methenyltetrahydrofolate cyclohydrolase